MRRRVYYIKGRAEGARWVDDVDRVEGKQQLRYLLGEYRLAYGPDYEVWVTDSHGRRLSEEEIWED